MCEGATAESHLRFALLQLKEGGAEAQEVTSLPKP
jgi:hypothetical protein